MKKLNMNKFKKCEDKDSLDRIMRSCLSDIEKEELNTYFRDMLKSTYNHVYYKDNNDYKKCDVCNQIFSNKPFENINAAGESLLSTIEIFDTKLIVCPKCTSSLNNWIMSRREIEVVN